MGFDASPSHGVLATPTKNEENQLKLLAKQVMGLSQAEVESGEFGADLMMMETLISEVRDDRGVVKDLWGKAQKIKQSRIVSGAEGAEVFQCSTVKSAATGLEVWMVCEK